MKKIFAQRLNHALELRQMKQIELSEKTGIPKSGINQYLKGIYVPKFDALYKIAKVLDVNIEWLVGYDEPMERKTQ